MNNISSFNFVVYSSQQDYFRVIFSDIIKLNNVDYIEHPITKYYGFFVKCLYNLHHWVPINRIINLPFKSYWTCLYFKNSFNDNKPICFIFLMEWIIKDNESFFKRLKCEYPTCKMIVYFEDIIASRNNRLDLDLIDKYFDLAISYDKTDAKFYGFDYYPTFYSKIVLPNDKRLIKTDASFIGAAKDRYNLIINLFKLLKQNNIKTYFAIGRYPKYIVKEKGVNYISYTIPYKKYLEFIANTNCIIEILQNGTTGYTLRTWEALVFNKKLLTNNPAIKTATFYNNKQFLYFNKIEEIDLTFITGKEVIEDSAYSEQLSPIFFLDYIVNKLSKT